MQYNSLNYEKLKDDKVQPSSARMNDQCRIEFKKRIRNRETVDITDLSNHYYK